MTNLETVEKAYQLFGAGDIESLRQLMDDQVSFINYGDYAFAGSHIGPSEIIERTFRFLLRAFLLCPSNQSGTGSAMIPFL